MPGATFGGALVFKTGKMRIAQICPYDLDRPGGVQLHIRDTAAALRDLGHDVTLIAPKVDRTRLAGEDEDADVVEVGRSAKIRFGGTAFEVSIAVASERRRLARLMGGLGFDVVHYHTVWTPFLPLQALASSRDPAVMTFHDTPPDSLLGDAGRLAQRGASRLLSPRIDGAIAVSDASRQNIHVRASRNMVVLPPCTDLSRFRAAVGAPGSDGNLNILFVGRLEPRKGVMVLLEAFHRLRAERTDVRLTIAGGGGEEARLRRYVAQHEVPDVEFLGRFSAEQAPALYAACDIFCAPSLYGESFGIVLAEAMASGKPVVAAANRGYRAVLSDVAGHCLAPPGDAPALHRRLAAMAGDADLRQRLGDWGRTQALRYDCRTIAPYLVDVYEEAIVRRRSRLADVRRSRSPAPLHAAVTGAPIDLRS